MYVEPISSDYHPYVKRFVEFGLWKGEKELPDGSCMGFGNAQEGLVAGFVFHDWNRQAGTVEMSAYSTNRKWTTREIVKMIFNYPFDELNVRLIVARHAETNRRVRRIWRALGATETLIPELWAPNVATAVVTLSKSGWLGSKFMSGTHGQA